MTIAMLVFAAACGHETSNSARALGDEPAVLPPILERVRQAPPGRPRLLVLTDIGGDPDDLQSLIRLLHYSNEFDIEGLIATFSGSRKDLSDRQVRPDLIRLAIEAYGEVQESLERHADGFPSVDELLQVVAAGTPRWGIDGIGPGKNTTASNLIVRAVSDPDPRPLNIAIWGGQADFAQALWQIASTREPEQVSQFIEKIRVHDIDDQDQLFLWIRQRFPNLWYILNRSQNGVSCSSTFRGMFLGGDTSTVTRGWIKEVIHQQGTRLSNLYPADGLWTCGNRINGVKEGDTPSWFYFLRNGLQEPEEPTWGGWGGRYRFEDGVYRDAQDTVGSDRSRMATVYRWRTHFQNSFAARLNWTTADPLDANHPPIIVLQGNREDAIAHFRALPGQRVRLDAAESIDPNEDQLNFNWWFYKEPSSYAGSIDLHGSHTSTVELVIPDDAQGTSIHLILEVKDDGAPPLTSVRRSVLHVQ